MTLSEERTDNSSSVEYPVSKSSMSAGASEISVPPEMRHEDIIVKDFLRKRNPLFRELDDLQEEIRHSPLADKHFKKQRKAADKPNQNTRKHFYKMHKKIGAQLHAATGAFTSPAHSSTTIRSLNLCMAPGGIASTILKVNPSASVNGITLSEESGGYAMILPFGNENSHVDVKFMDITMLPIEFGPPNAKIPIAHPEAAKFVEDSPYQNLEFDIVACEGQNLRTHKRAACRDSQEAFRLLLSQLIFGMNRIRAGGTLVVLLHQLGSWNSVKLLRTFDSFSKIQLFKSRNFHQNRSSFYLVAKDVQPDVPEAIKSIEQWKSDWWQTTFGGVEFTGAIVEDNSVLVNSVLESFGEKFMELAREIWKIHLEAMRVAPYVK